MLHFRSPQTQACVTITLPLPLVHRKHAVSAARASASFSDKFREEEEKRASQRKGGDPNSQAEQGREVARKIGIPKVATHGSSSDAIPILGSPHPTLFGSNLRLQVSGGNLIP